MTHKAKTRTKIKRDNRTNMNSWSARPNIPYNNFNGKGRMEQSTSLKSKNSPTNKFCNDQRTKTHTLILIYWQNKTLRSKWSPWAQTPLTLSSGREWKRYLTGLHEELGSKMPETDISNSHRYHFDHQRNHCQYSRALRLLSLKITIRTTTAATQKLSQDLHQTKSSLICHSSRT